MKAYDPNGSDLVIHSQTNYSELLTTYQHIDRSDFGFWIKHLGIESLTCVALLGTFYSPLHHPLLETFQACCVHISFSHSLCILDGNECSYRCNLICGQC